MASVHRADRAFLRISGAGAGYDVDDSIHGERNHCGGSV